MALAKELELAKDLDIKHLVIQMDNHSCIQIIQSKDCGRGECSHLLARCLLLIESDDWSVKLSHVHREGNRAAN